MTCVTAAATTPTVSSKTPADAAPDVAINTTVTVTFSETMDPTTLNENTFTLMAGTVMIMGNITHTQKTATFWPAANLDPSTPFTVTLSTGAKSAPGVALAASTTWHFTTGTAVAPGLGVNLATAGNYVILAKSGIDTVPTSIITGDIGVSPVTETAITHFSLTRTSADYSHSDQVSGKVYAAQDSPTTTQALTTAVSDMQLAFTDAAGRAPDVTGLLAGTFGSPQTLAPGVYKWSSGLLISADLTLNGDATSVWIFQIAQGLTVANSQKILLTGGALPQNVFWQVSGAVNLGSSSQFRGIVLCQTAITLVTGATMEGRLFAQTAVNLQSSTVAAP